MPTLPRPPTWRACSTLRPTQREVALAPTAVARTPLATPRPPRTVTLTIFAMSLRIGMHPS
jgi:hypothetical protein